MTEREDFVRQEFSNDRLPVRLQPLAEAFSTLAVTVAAIQAPGLVQKALSQLKGARDLALLASIEEEEGGGA